MINLHASLIGSNQRPEILDGMVFKRSFFITLGIVSLLVLAFGAGYFFRDYRSSALERFTIFASAYEILQKNGLKEIPTDGPDIEYGMIRGMLEAYGDPYTIFVEPTRHELDTNALQGSYGGIGVELMQDSEGRWLLYPYPDSPAARAGVLEGDWLVAVDGTQILPETSAEELQSAIRGPVGRRIRLTIAHLLDTSPVEISIRREEIAIPSLTWRLDSDDPRVGIIDINLIAASTTKEIQDAVEDLQNRKAAYFVLDLRSNPGGLLTAGVDIARLFLKDGVIIQQQYRGRDVETFRVERPGPLSDIPLAVLIDGSSASAAEIIAGALQAHNRAILVGSPSFGKDTIQLVFNLPDDSSLHVTAAQWWIPNLEYSLSENGLQPDILVTPPSVDSSPGQDDVLQAAVTALTQEN